MFVALGVVLRSFRVFFGVFVLGMGGGVVVGGGGARLPAGRNPGSVMSLLLFASALGVPVEDMDVVVPARSRPCFSPV